MRWLPLLALLAPTLAWADDGPQAITPTGASAPLTLPALAAQQGVLWDAYKLGTDPDDTLALGRAVTAGKPILCGPKTYTVNNFSSSSVTNFTLIGVPGCIVQRTSASGANWVTINTANVYIAGVTFDSNKASVTANQWGVLLPAAGQTVAIRNSVFKNNSGTLGACFALLSTGPGAGGSFVFDGNEVTGCASQGAYFGSVTNGRITNSYFHDNAAFGAFVGAYLTASSTNYLSDVLISNNRIFRNVNGVSIGGIAPPYVYGTPAAVGVNVVNNLFEDNTASALIMQGDHMLATSNRFRQSAPGVTVNTAIDSNSRYTLIANNAITYAGSSYGIDTGGSVDSQILANRVTVTSGTALNSGGSQNCTVRNNTLNVSGTAHAVTVYDVDTDGSGNPFPNHTSALDIENNVINLSGASAAGLALFDDAGGASGALPVIFANNQFTSSGTSSNSAISYMAGGAALTLGNNTWNGSVSTFVNPNGSNDIVLGDVFDSVSTSGGASATIRAVLTSIVNTYNAGGSILWVMPSAGGANYTAATTLAASGGCTWTGTALISQGVIVGVRTNTVGTSCSGATVSATDTGGGTGATFTATNTPSVLSNRRIQLTSGSVTSVLQGSGGAVSLSPGNAILLQVHSTSGQVITLVGNGGTKWEATVNLFPIIAVGSLPTCNAAASGAFVNVTGSTSSKWQAKCNGTNWLWPDGTTVSG
jgi:Right handed beta helix region